MKTKLLLSMFVASSIGVAGAADIVGANSKAATNAANYIEIGKSNVWAPFNIHNKEKAGVGVQAKDNKRLSKKKKVDFGGLSRNSKTDKLVDKGVTVNHLYKTMEGNENWWKIHKGIGSFDFVQVGNADVWFGEWSESGAKDNFKGRQVYYVGDKTGTTLPTGGTASYTVYGINKFNGSNLMEGFFDADFTAKTLTGELYGDVSTLTIDAKIKSDASFNGTAKFDTVAGKSKGHFFGNQAASLAGIAEFDNKDLNTAFGGTKD